MADDPLTQQPRDWAPPAGPPVIPGEPPGSSGPAGTQDAPSATGGRRAPAPDPEERRRAGRALVHFSVLVLASVVCSRLPLPWQLASLAFALPAAVLGVVATVRAVRARLGSGLVLFTAFGVALAGLLVLTQALSLIAWDATVARQECLQEALSPTAQRECERDYRRQVEEMLRPNARS